MLILILWTDFRWFMNAHPLNGDVHFGYSDHTLYTLTSTRPAKSLCPLCANISETPA